MLCFKPKKKKRKRPDPLVYQIAVDVMSRHAELIIKWSTDMNQSQREKIVIDELRSLQFFFMKWVDNSTAHINRKQLKELTSDYNEIYDYVSSMFPNADMDSLYYFRIPPSPKIESEEE